MGSTAESANRRSFLLKGAAVGAGAVGAGLLADTAAADASGGLTRGDAAILRFLAAAEILETDLWQQYNELAGIQDQRSPRRKREPGVRRGGRGAGRGHGPVHPRQHRRRDQPLHLHQRLPGGARRGNGQPGQVPHPAQQHGDRRPADRTADQPDAADRQHQLLDALPQRLAEHRPRRHAPTTPFRTSPPASTRPSPGRTPTCRRRSTCRRSPTPPASTSPGSSKAGRASTPRSPSGSPIPRCCAILLSIGGSEIMHFQTWQDKAGNAPPLTDPTTGLTFPDLNADGELTQTNLIMPEPTRFLDRKFPESSQSSAPPRPTAPPWARSRP